MRKIFLLMWACYALMQAANGQNYTVSATPPPTDIDAQISFALSDIDLSPVTSGILKDKTTLMGHPYLFGCPARTPSPLRGAPTRLQIIQYLLSHGWQAVVHT